MRSRLLQKRGATAPVVTMPNGQHVPDEDDFGGLFCTEEEEDRAIQTILADDPEGEKGIPWKQVKAELDRELAARVEAALRRLCEQ